MVRSELLRAKSLHAEVAYLEDLKRVGDAKRAVDERDAVLKNKQKQFWSEAAKDAHIPTQLDRMRRAYSQVQEAQAKHERANETLKAGLEILSGSQKRIDVLDKMIGKAQRIRANQVESRLSEEVVDLVNTSRAVHSLRRRIGTEVRDNTECSSLTAGYGGDCARLMRPENSTNLSVLPQNHYFTLSAPNSKLPQPVASTQGPPQFGISNVSVASIQNQPSLSLTCAMGASGTVGLQIIKCEAQGFKVTIDPSAGSLASGVVRDRAAIQSRLRALGIKVDALDIACLDSTPGASKRSKRSTTSTKDDEDENTIS
jgi:hypothetical protein